MEDTHRKMMDHCVVDVYEAIFGRKDEAVIELFKKTIEVVTKAMENNNMTLKEFLKKKFLKNMKETERDVKPEKKWADMSLALAMCVMYMKGILDSEAHRNSQRASRKL